jgi:hypothetical protein
MWIVVFWVAIPRSIVGGYQCFGGAYHLHFQSKTPCYTRKYNITLSIMFISLSQKFVYL